MNISGSNALDSTEIGHVARRSVVEARWI